MYSMGVNKLVNFGLICLLFSASLWAHAELFGSSHEEGIAAFKRGDYEAAASALSDAATQDDPEAYYYLGNLYRKGLGGLSRDPMGAYRLLKAAAAEGFAPACMDLADWYSKGGEGIKTSPDLAILWWQKAANLHVLAAQLRLADIYEKGWRGVLPDLELARHWLEQAVAQGDSGAEQRIEHMATADPGVAVSASPDIRPADLAVSHKH